jgi:hypothetical protein
MTKNDRTPRVRSILALLFLVIVSAMQSACAVTPGEAKVLRAKANHAQNELTIAVEDGKDVSAIIPMMKRVKTLADRGKIKKARSLLDEILGKLQELNQTSTVIRTQPDNPQVFINPKKVNIIGYNDNAMEAFISRDGRFLFFNNDKTDTPKTDKNIYYARRIDDTSFEFMGEVKGVNSAKVDGVPTMDNNGNFYFVSAVHYSKKNGYAIVYSGKFNDGRVTDITPHPELSLNKYGWLNMDIEISADGSTLYATHTYFDFHSNSPPKESYFFVAYLKGNKFVIDERSDEIFRYINTNNQEYAASISTDELEILFTRLSQEDGFTLNSYRSTRKSKNEPFSVPTRIKSITGIAEAPALTNDGRLLYFHKKKAGRFNIYVLERNAN